MGVDTKASNTDFELQLTMKAEGRGATKGGGGKGALLSKFADIKLLHSGKVNLKLLPLWKNSRGTPGWKLCFFFWGGGGKTDHKIVWCDVISHSSQP